MIIFIPPPKRTKSQLTGRNNARLKKKKKERSLTPTRELRNLSANREEGWDIKQK